MKVRALIADYCVNSQMHGLKFLGQPRRHWTERVFWLVCICASWYGCLLVMRSSWVAYQTNSLSFGTETTYLEWNTSLFAVSVCEYDNEDRIEQLASSLCDTENCYNLKVALSNIVYFRGAEYSFSRCFEDLKGCPKTDLRKVSLSVRAPCNETFYACAWNNATFECCDYFQVLETELGPCFSLNSKQVKEPRPLQLVSNRLSGPGSLSLDLLVPAVVYVHSVEDLPNFNTIDSEQKIVQLDSYTRRRYTVTETDNEPAVRGVSIDQRRCRFADENYLSMYGRYSYTACLVECRAAAMLRLCNCTGHLLPATASPPACDLEGLSCLQQEFLSYGVLAPEWSKVGLSCHCLPECSEPEFDLVEDYSWSLDDDELATIELAVSQLSTIRFKRSVVRSSLDLVVSLGGTVGLFVGASLLSFVELICFFTVRLYGSLRLERARAGPAGVPPLGAGDRSVK